MIKTLTCLFLVGLLCKSHALTISWVGDSIACDGTTNTHNTLSAALFAALLNNDDDEIRLTAQATYTGGANGRYDLVDWSPNTTGSLILKGGYSDCQTNHSGRTIMGQTSGIIMSVSTSSQSQSVVRLENLEIRGGDVGVELSGGAEVTLDNTVVKNHTQGIRVTNGAFLNVLANSTIERNDNYSDFNSRGGGIHCSGEESLVTFKGTLTQNRSSRGGNLYVGDHCFVELEAGSQLIGAGDPNQSDGVSGGAVFVETFGEVFATGN